MTTTQLRALVEQRDECKEKFETCFCLDQPKWRTKWIEAQGKLDAALPAYLTSQAERDEQLVETAVEAFRKDVDDNFCDMSPDTKITSAIRILRAVLAPSLSAVVARMEGEES